MKPVVSPVRVAVNNNFMSEPFYILGHRGAAGEHPENTLQGFAHAMQVGVHMIELDIREHDSELWIFHDAKLDRLTNASGSFADCADPGQIELANGEPIPRLKVLLDMAWGRMPLNIEIKTIEQPGLLLKLLDGYAPPEPRADLPWILISSFNHRVLLELKELGCQWPLAPIDSGIPLDVGADIDRLAPTSCISTTSTSISTLSRIFASAASRAWYSRSTTSNGRVNSGNTASPGFLPIYPPNSCGSTKLGVS